MSLWSRSYLAIALILPVASACSEGTNSEQTDEDLPDDESGSVDDGDSDDEDDDGTDEEDAVTDDGDDEEPASDDDDDEDGTGASPGRDSGSTARPDAGRDASSAPGDARVTGGPDSGTTSRADSAVARSDSGTASRPDSGRPTTSTPSNLDGECCDDGDCICRDPVPRDVTSRAGSFGVADFGTLSGTVYYPRDAEPPFSGVALCGGFLNTGPEMTGWGRYFASYGIVTLITSTSAVDIPDVRALLLAGAVEEMKDQNTSATSPLYQKMSGRYGTAGYSMGGAGTTIAASGDDSLKSSMGLAAWYPVGRGVTVPTLLLCGSIDAIAGCNLSDDAYNTMPETTPKMVVEVPLSGHLSWFDPGGISGPYGLAFHKTYLDGDTRWLPLLTGLGNPRASNIR